MRESQAWRRTPLTILKDSSSRVAEHRPRTRATPRSEVSQDGPGLKEERAWRKSNGSRCWAMPMRHMLSILVGPPPPSEL